LREKCEKLEHELHEWQAKCVILEKKCEGLAEDDDKDEKTIKYWKHKYEKEHDEKEEEEDKAKKQKEKKKYWKGEAFGWKTRSEELEKELKEALEDDREDAAKIKVLQHKLKDAKEDDH
jgi:hypothetical protein